MTLYKLVTSPENLEAAAEEMALLEAMDVTVRARCHRECDRESDPNEKGVHLAVVQEAVVGWSLPYLPEWRNRDRRSEYERQRHQEVLAAAAVTIRLPV